MADLIQVKKTYTIQQYKKGVHKMFTKIKVKSKKGKIFNVYKIDVATHSGTSSSRGGGEFSIGEITRSSKAGIIKYLQEH